MKKLTLIAIAALIAGQITLKTAPQTAPPQIQTGTIRGKVIREGTMDPISGVQIFMNGTLGTPAPSVITPLAIGGVIVANGVVVSAAVPGAPANPPAAVTDSGGAFEIRDVPAGKQVVTASKEGYFGTSRVAVQPSVQENTTVTAGKTTEVSFVLVPGGLIAGRVTTSTGENAPDVAVQALRLSYQDANPILQSVGTRVTDDRGEYRLFRLPPGQYYVVAGQVGGGPVGRGGGVRGTGGAPPAPPPPIAFPNPSVRTFYPDTTEASQAIAVQVRGGDEVGGINIRVQPLSGTRKISGQVLTTIPLADMGPSARTRASQDAAGGAAPGAAGVRIPAPDVPDGVIQIVTTGGNAANATLTLYPRGKGGPQDPAGGINTASVLVEPQNGRFEFSNIPRGTYDLFASVPDLKGYGPAQPPGLAATPVAYGRTIVEVGDRDVDGVRIIAHHGVDVKGRILVDGSPSPAAANVKVSLQVDDGASRIANYLQIGRFQPAIDADGSFMIPAVSEALYRFQVTLGAAPAAQQTGGALPVTPLNANAYVADILEGGASVYDNGIHVGDQPLGSIDILIRTDGGSIEGVVRGANQMPAGGATVVLVPSQSHQSNPMFYKSTTSDPMGRFSLRGVAPGEYKIFAWATPPGTAYRNADFMKKYEGKGAFVKVVAGTRPSTPTVDLTTDEGL